MYIYENYLTISTKYSPIIISKFLFFNDKKLGKCILNDNFFSIALERESAILRKT